MWRLQRGARARGHHGGHGPGANGRQDLLGPATKCSVFHDFWSPLDCAPRCFTKHFIEKIAFYRGSFKGAIFDGKRWEKSLDNIWNMWELCVFRLFLMGKTMEHDGKRFGTCGETIHGFNGFDGKNVEACGSLRWSNAAMGNFRTKWRCYRTIIYQWWIFQPFWSEYQRRNANSIQFQWLKSPWNHHLHWLPSGYLTWPWYSWPIEIDGLPFLKMVIFHGYVSHNQRVHWLKPPWNSYLQSLTPHEIHIYSRLLKGLYPSSLWNCRWATWKTWQRWTDLAFPVMILWKKQWVLSNPRWIGWRENL